MAVGKKNEESTIDEGGINALWAAQTQSATWVAKADGRLKHTLLGWRHLDPVNVMKLKQDFLGERRSSALGNDSGFYCSFPAKETGKPGNKKDVNSENQEMELCNRNKTKQGKGEGN